MLFSIIDNIRIFTTKLRDDYVASFSAHAAFFTLISLFPFLMFLFTLLQFLPINAADVISLFIKYIPDFVSPTVTVIVNEIFNEVSTTFISVTIISTMYAASKGFFAILRGMNFVYGIKETRNYIHLCFISILYTLIFAVMLLISFVLLVFGNQILAFLLKIIPGLGHFSLLISIIRLIGAELILSLFFLYIYMVIPNRRSKIKYEIRGAIFTSVGWIGFSALYSYYIDHFANYTNTYGSLTAIVLFMLWLYFCMYIMFLGAELNCLLTCWYENGKDWKKVRNLYAVPPKTLP